MTLADQIAALCDPLPFRTYWQVKLLDTQEVCGRGDRLVLPAASVRKTSVLMAALRAVHEGRLDLDAPVQIRSELQPGVVSGVCQYMTPGVAIPMRDMMLLMMIASDNICTYEVMKDLDLGEITDYCRRIGMVDTVHRTKLPPVGLSADHALEKVTTTTAADQVLLLELIMRGVHEPEIADRLMVTPQLCLMAMQFLSWQRFRNMIPALLPLGTAVAHKTGRGQRGWMDAGIVFRDGRPAYIISATTDDVPETMPDGLPGHSAATQTIARLSRVVWDSLA